MPNVEESPCVQSARWHLPPSYSHLCSNSRKHTPSVNTSQCQTRRNHRTGSLLCDHLGLWLLQGHKLLSGGKIKKTNHDFKSSCKIAETKTTWAQSMAPCSKYELTSRERIMSSFEGLSVFLYLLSRPFCLSCDASRSGPNQKCWVMGDYFDISNV